MVNTIVSTIKHEYIKNKKFHVTLEGEKVTDEEINWNILLRSSK